MPIAGEAALTTPLRATSAAASDAKNRNGSRRPIARCAYDRIVLHAARAADTALRLLPDAAAIAAAEALLRAIERADPEWGRVAGCNLRLAGIQSPGLMDRLRRNMARAIVDFARGHQAPLEIEGLQHYRHARCAGAVILAGAHLGNWELARCTHARLHGPLTAPVNPSGNPHLDRFVAARRARSGARTLPAAGCARDLIRALHGGCDVGMLDDFDLGLAGGIFAEWFGVTTFLSTAIARLAALARAPVVPWFCVWEQDRYVLRYEPALHFRGDIVASTCRLAAWYESKIRLYPDQWMWMHMRWRTRPPGEPPLYG